MSQKFTLYNDLTVQENLSFAAALRKMEPRQLRERENELFSFIAFNPSKDTLVKDLPGGIKQQVSLIAAMLHDPEIIFLDEPTAGVSPVARKQFWNLIRNLAARGKTIFVTTHYMDEAEQCGRIALMRDGKIIALDSPEGLKATAFKEALYELDPIPGASLDWISKIEKQKMGWSIRPYGRRYHLTAPTLQEWENYLPNIIPFAHVKKIQPSLEDVFIQMVEGSQ